jgi:hypothetical protein
VITADGSTADVTNRCAEEVRGTGSFTASLRYGVYKMHNNEHATADEDAVVVGGVPAGEFVGV